MQVRQAAVTLKGSPLNVAGPLLKVGDKAPDFTCATGMKDTITLGQLPAKPKLFSVVPSLDTPVCSVQTKRFADELVALGDQVACYTVSTDLPFAQNRFCNEKSITTVKNLSDTHNGSFGNNYGVRIEGLALPILMRAVFVVDKMGTITHAEYVPEIASEPNYETALSALKMAM